MGGDLIDQGYSNLRIFKLGEFITFLCFVITRNQTWCFANLVLSQVGVEPIQGFLEEIPLNSFTQAIRLCFLSP